MKIYFSVDENNRLQGISSTPSNNKEMLEIDNDHEIAQNPMESFFYKYVDGKLIKDKDYQNQWVVEKEAERKKPTDAEMNAIAIMELTQMLLGGE